MRCFDCHFDLASFLLEVVLHKQEEEERGQRMSYHQRNLDRLIALIIRPLLFCVVLPQERTWCSQLRPSASQLHLQHKFYIALSSSSSFLYFEWLQPISQYIV